MIAAILNVFLVILFILVKTKIVPFNLFWKCSPLIVLLLLMFGFFIPMGWGAPFVVRVKLNDAKLAASLPAGTAGAAAICTPHIKLAHIIRKVILRHIAIVNYVNPF